MAEQEQVSTDPIVITSARMDELLLESQRKLKTAESPFSDKVSTDSKPTQPVEAVDQIKQEMSWSLRLKNGLGSVLKYVGWQI